MPDMAGLVTPVVACGDPVNPTLIAFVEDGAVCLVVEWVVAMHSLDKIGHILTTSHKSKSQKRHLKNLVLALAAVLATNEPDKRSFAGYEHETGNVFVRDSFPAFPEDVVQIEDRLIGVVSHSRDIRQNIRLLCSGEFDLPDSPEPPFPNGYSLN